MSQSRRRRPPGRRARPTRRGRGPRPPPRPDPEGRPRQPHRWTGTRTPSARRSRRWQPRARPRSSHLAVDSAGASRPRRRRPRDGRSRAHHARLGLPLPRLRPTRCRRHRNQLTQRRRPSRHHARQRRAPRSRRVAADRPHHLGLPEGSDPPPGWPWIMAVAQSHPACDRPPRVCRRRSRSRARMPHRRRAPDRR